MNSNSSLAITLAGSTLASLLFGGCATTPLRQSTAEWSTAPASSSDVVAPKALQTNAAPAYPFALRRAGIAGLVNVDCVIDSSGRVLTATVTDTAHHALSAPTLAAVRGWTFEPGTRNGVASAMLVSLPIEYVLVP